MTVHSTSRSRSGDIAREAWQWGKVEVGIQKARRRWPWFFVPDLSWYAFRSMGVFLLASIDAETHALCAQWKSRFGRGAVQRRLPFAICPFADPRRRNPLHQSIKPISRIRARRRHCCLLVAGGRASQYQMPWRRGGREGAPSRSRRGGRCSASCSKRRVTNRKIGDRTVPVAPRLRGIGHRRTPLRRATLRQRPTIHRCERYMSKCDG